MIRSPLFVALLLLLPSPARAGSDVLRERSEKILEPAGLRVIRVDNSRGDVRITASTDGRIHVEALKLIRANSGAESRRMADELHVDIATEAGQLIVRARYPTRRSVRVGFWDLFRDYEWPSAELRLGVAVPAGLALAVRTSSGDIETGGVNGPQTLETTSGDVHIEDARGGLDVSSSSGDIDGSGIGPSRFRTASGDVELKGVQGALDVHTTSGDLTVSDAADSLLLGTVSGDIQVERAAGPVSATTSNGQIRVRRARGRVDLGTSTGDVDLGLVAPLTAVTVVTGSGDVTVRFDRGMSARLELQTSNGQLQMESPIQVLSLTRRRVTGQLHQGGAAVSLRSASGDIHVLTGEQGS